MYNLPLCKDFLKIFPAGFVNKFRLEIVRKSKQHLFTFSPFRNGLKLYAVTLWYGAVAVQNVP